MKKHFKLQGMFSTMLFSYIIILLVPGFLTFGLMAAAYQLSYKNSLTGAAGELERGRVLFERQLEMMDDNAAEFTYDYVLGWILQLREGETLEKNITSVAKFRERLNDRFRDTGILKHYTVLLSNELIFNQNTMVIGSEFYFDNYRSYESLSYEEYREVSFSSDGRTLLPVQDIGSGKSKLRAMTYTYALKKSLRPEAKADAVIQFLIPEEDIKGLFYGLLQDTGSQVFIIAPDGQVLACIAEGGVTDPMMLDTGRLTGDQGSFKQTDGKERFAVTYCRSAGSGLQYAVVIAERVLLQDIKVLAAVLGLLLIGSLLLELFLGIYFSGKYARPLHNLLLNIQRFLAPDQQREDAELPEGKQIYHHLSAGINQLARQNQRIFLNYLYSGAMKQDRQIIKEARYGGIYLGKKQYCVIVLRLSAETDGSALSLEVSDDPRFLAVSWMESNIIVCLLGEEQLEEAAVAAMAARMRGNLAAQNAVIRSIGAGRVYGQESMITFSYMQAQYAAELTDGEYVKYSELSLQQNVFVYPTGLAEKLVNTVKYGEDKQIEQIFTYIYEENTGNRQLSGSMEKMLLSVITATLFKLYDDLVPDEEISRIMQDTSHYPDLHSALMRLQEQFMKARIHVQSSKEDRQEETRQMLADYIDRWYADSQLGVAKAATDFALSEGYFSQYFKEVMGEAFSTYLERYRINRAKELIGFGELDIEQIAVAVGYSSSGTFRRAFKRMTGLTPSVWRKEQQL